MPAPSGRQLPPGGAQPVGRRGSGGRTTQPSRPKKIAGPDAGPSANSFSGAGQCQQRRRNVAAERLGHGRHGRSWNDDGIRRPGNGRSWWAPAGWIATAQDPAWAAAVGRAWAADLGGTWRSRWWAVVAPGPMGGPGGGRPRRVAAPGGDRGGPGMGGPRAVPVAVADPDGFRTSRRRPRRVPDWQGPSRIPWPSATTVATRAISTMVGGEISPSTIPSGMRRPFSVTGANIAKPSSAKRGAADSTSAVPCEFPGLVTAGEAYPIYRSTCSFQHNRTGTISDPVNMPTALERGPANFSLSAGHHLRSP